MAVLGISTNTRLLGTAIIHKGLLTEYQVRLYKASWSPSKATRIITSLEPCVRRYCITEVILSIPPRHHQTAAFRELIGVIKTFCKERSIAVHTKTMSQVYSLCPADGWKTRNALMQVLVQRFPQLLYYHKKELRNKNKYYIKMFEAVAVAMLYH